MATISEPPEPAPEDLTLPQRLQRLLWAFSGMFSAAALGLAFTGYFGAGAFEAANTNFLAAVVSAGLFGVVSLLKFGPASA